MFVMLSWFLVVGGCGYRFQAIIMTGTSVQSGLSERTEYMTFLVAIVTDRVLLACYLEPNRPCSKDRLYLKLSIFWRLEGHLIVRLRLRKYPVSPVSPTSARACNLPETRHKLQGR